MNKRCIGHGYTLAQMFEWIATMQDEIRDGLRAEPVVSRHCNAFRCKLSFLKVFAYVFAVAKWWAGRPRFNCRYVEYLALAHWRSDEYAALREAMEPNLNTRDPNIIFS